MPKLEQLHGKPKECFISYRLLDSILISKLSRMVILVPQQGSQLMIQPNVESLFRNFKFLCVRVQRYTKSTFLLSTDRSPSSHTLYQALDIILAPDIESGLFTVQPWTSDFQSTRYTASQQPIKQSWNNWTAMQFIHA